MFPHTPTSSHGRDISITAEDQSRIPFLRLCSFISRLAQVAGAASSLVNLAMLFTISMPATELVLRCYCVAFGALIVMVEAELPWLLTHMAFLQSWVARGVSFSFVGLLDLHTATATDGDDNSFGAGDGPSPSSSSSSSSSASSLSNTIYLMTFWRNFVGALVITAGLAYFALGIFCFRRLKNLAIGKIKRQKIMKEEVHHLTAQKMEIERLLADTESKLQSL